MIMKHSCCPVEYDLFTNQDLKIKVNFMVIHAWIISCINMKFKRANM